MVSFNVACGDHCAGFTEEDGEAGSSFSREYLSRGRSGSERRWNC